MNQERFRELIDNIRVSSLEVLAEKNAKYAPATDALHNFNGGADIAGCTPAQALWGYMTKHLVALRDMVMDDDFGDMDDFREKCIDTINYVCILWAIGNDD